VFKCHLLQSAEGGEVTVERALVHVARAHEQIQHTRTLLARLGSCDNGLPLKERCAEALAGEGRTAAERQDRADLETAMAALERTIWNTFLGSERPRV
jgi:hypothetical protein